MLTLTKENLITIITTAENEVSFAYRILGFEKDFESLRRIINNPRFAEDLNADISDELMAELVELCLNPSTNTFVKDTVSSRVLKQISVHLEDILSLAPLISEYRPWKNDIVINLIKLIRRFPDFNTPNIKETFITNPFNDQTWDMLTILHELHVSHSVVDTLLKSNCANRIRQLSDLRDAIVSNALPRVCANLYMILASDGFKVDQFKSTIKSAVSGDIKSKIRLEILGLLTSVDLLNFNSVWSALYGLYAYGDEYLSALRGIINLILSSKGIDDSNKSNFIKLVIAIRNEFHLKNLCSILLHLNNMSCLTAELVTLFCRDMSMCHHFEFNIVENRFINANFLNVLMKAGLYNKDHLETYIRLVSKCKYRSSSMDELLARIFDYIKPSKENIDLALAVGNSWTNPILHKYLAPIINKLRADKIMNQAALIEIDSVVKKYTPDQFNPTIADEIEITLNLKALVGQAEKLAKLQLPDDKEELTLLLFGKKVSEVTYTKDTSFVKLLYLSIKSWLNKDAENINRLNDLLSRPDAFTNDYELLIGTLINHPSRLISEYSKLVIQHCLLFQENKRSADDLLFDLKESGRNGINKDFSLNFNCEFGDIRKKSYKLRHCDLRLFKNKQLSLLTTILSSPVVKLHNVSLCHLLEVPFANVQAILNALSNKVVEEFTFVDNNITKLTKEEFSAFCNAIKNSNIKKLNLSNCKLSQLSDDDLKLLLDAVNGSKIITLNLKNNGFLYCSKNKWNILCEFIENAKFYELKSLWLKDLEDGDIPHDKRERFCLALSKTHIHKFNVELVWQPKNDDDYFQGFEKYIENNYYLEQIFDKSYKTYPGSSITIRNSNYWKTIREANQYIEDLSLPDQIDVDKFNLFYDLADNIHHKIRDLINASGLAQEMYNALLTVQNQLHYTAFEAYYIKAIPIIDPSYDDKLNAFFDALPFLILSNGRLINLTRDQQIVLDGIICDLCHIKTIDNTNTIHLLKNEQRLNLLCYIMLHKLKNIIPTEMLPIELKADFSSVNHTNPNTLLQNNPQWMMLIRTISLREDLDDNDKLIINAILNNLPDPTPLTQIVDATDFQTNINKRNEFVQKLVELMDECSLEERGILSKLLNNELDEGFTPNSNYSQSFMQLYSFYNHVKSNNKLALSIYAAILSCITKQGLDALHEENPTSRESFPTLQELTIFKVKQYISENKLAANQPPEEVKDKIKKPHCYPK